MAYAFSLGCSDRRGSSSSPGLRAEGGWQLHLKLLFLFIYLVRPEQADQAAVVSACSGANMIPVWQMHAEHCVQIQISNRFCGGPDVLGYPIEMFWRECTDQQIANNFSI